MTSFGTHQTRADLNRADLAAALGSAFQPVRRLRDQTQVTGTVGIWDFASAWGAPGGYQPMVDVPLGTTMRNMVDGGPAAVRDVAFGSMTYERGGLKIGGDGSLKLAAAAWKPGMMLTAWFRSTDMTAGFNGRLLKLGPIFIVPLPDNFQVYGPGLAVGGLDKDLGGAVRDGKLHQLSVQSESLGGGNHRVVIRLDRIVLYEGPSGAAGPADSVEYAIGARDGAGTISGTIYRARLDDTTLSATADEIIAADYRANFDRLRLLAA